MTRLLLIAYFAIGAWAFRYRCQIEPELCKEYPHSGEFLHSMNWPLAPFFYFLFWPIALPFAMSIRFANGEFERARTARKERLKLEAETRRALKELGVE